MAENMEYCVKISPKGWTTDIGTKTHVTEKLEGPAVNRKLN